MRPRNPCFLPIERELDQVREYIVGLIPSASPFVTHMAQYFLKSRGQLLRPSLVLTTARLEGAPAQPQRAIEFSALVELIHAASLLHDDVVDQGRFRRKMRTVNALWGNKEAVLLGDLVLARALSILARYPEPEFLAAAERITYSLSVGELMELEHAANVQLATDDYERIISFKTADFFRECCFLGGLAARTRPGNLDRLAQAGHCLGMAYQILDDLLDVVGSLGTVGKDTALDFLNGNVTLPVICTLEQARDPAGAAALRSAFERRDMGYIQTRLPAQVRECGAYDDTLLAARRYAHRAMEFLSGLEGPGAPEVVETLRGFTDYMFERLARSEVAPGAVAPTA